MGGRALNMRGQSDERNAAHLDWQVVSNFDDDFLSRTVLAVWSEEHDGLDAWRAGVDRHASACRHAVIRQSQVHLAIVAIDDQRVVQNQ